MRVGVFGDASRVKALGLRPSVVYVDSRKLKAYREGVVPLIWVPLAASAEEGVVDAFGSRSLFAFGNSGCISNPSVQGKVLGELRRLADLGYRAVLLDALRLPSPHDGLLFLSVCFCEHSVSVVPQLERLREEVKHALAEPSPRALRDLLEKLARARAREVEALLGRIREEACELGVELVAAVFPYPLSRYVGQDPRVLYRYLDEVHVMLYHRCSGPACLNHEAYSLYRTFLEIGLGERDALRLLGSVLQVERGDLARSLETEGVPLEMLEVFMRVNGLIYRDKYVPIVWLDEDIAGKVSYYLEEYGRLDLFAPKG